MAQRIHQQIAAFDHLGFFGLDHDMPVGGILTPQKGADTFHQQALRERLFHIVIGAHAQTQHLVDLIILGGEEDHGHLRFLAQALQEIHSIHARHLDVEHGHVGQFLAEGVKGLLAIIIGFNLKAFGFECHGYGCQNIPVIVHEGDFGHSSIPFTARSACIFCATMLCFQSFDQFKSANQSGRHGRLTQKFLENG